MKKYLFILLSIYGHYCTAQTSYGVTIRAQRAGYVDEALIAFHPNAKDTADLYDSRKMFTDDVNYPQLYTKITGAGNYAINTQKGDTLDRVLNLGFKAAVADSFSISAVVFRSLPIGTQVFLQDLSTGQTVNLFRTAKYSFYSAIVNNAARFKIHILFPKSAIWQGNTNNWNVANNWSNNRVPDAATSVTIPATNNRAVVNTNIGQIYNLTIKPKANLTIDSNATMVVLRKLTLQSDSSGFASLVRNTYGNLVLDSNASVQLFLPDANRYYYVSSPVYNATASAFGDNTQLNSDYKLWFYNANQWQRITDANTTLQPATGYTFKSPNDSTTFVFQGQLNSLSTSCTLNDNAFTLVGNPYPCSLDWGLNNNNPDWLNDTQVSSTIWYRKGGEGSSTGNDGTFYTYNRNGGGSVNGNVGLRYIPPMQSFWVKNLTINTTLNIPAKAQTHTANKLYKNNTLSNGITITLSNSRTSDQTLVAFNTSARNETDKFDSEKMLSNSQCPQIYSLFDSKKWAINTFEHISTPQTLPLGVQLFADGEYSIHFDAFNVWDNQYTVFLEDLVTKDLVAIHVNETYKFSSAAGVFNQRFVLHLHPNTQTSVLAETNTNNVAVYSYGTNIYVKSDEPCFLQVFDMQGNEIMQKTTTTMLNAYSLSKSGIYIVRTTTNTSTACHKLMINN